MRSLFAHARLVASVPPVAAASAAGFPVGDAHFESGDAFGLGFGRGCVGEGEERGKEGEEGGGVHFGWFWEVWW